MPVFSEYCAVTGGLFPDMWEDELLGTEPCSDHIHSIGLWNTQQFCDTMIKHAFSTCKHAYTCVYVPRNGALSSSWKKWVQLLAPLCTLFFFFFIFDICNVIFSLIFSFKPFSDALFIHFNWLNQETCSWWMLPLCSWSIQNRHKPFHASFTSSSFLNRHALFLDLPVFPHLLSVLVVPLTRWIVVPAVYLHFTMLFLQPDIMYAAFLHQQ